jgi:hypothetical protein
MKSLSLAARPQQPRPHVWSRLRPTRRHVILVVAAAMLASPGVAVAEGGFDSSLSGVRSGYVSRQWTDRNLDGASTTTQVSGCSRSDGANFFLDVELRKRRSFQPDVSYGRQNVSACRGGAPTANWGRPGAGDFFNQFWHYDFGTVSASSVRVRF